MSNGLFEYKLIDEFDHMPFKKAPGIVDSMNHFIFPPHKNYFVSDLVPNYKNMIKMYVRIKRLSPNLSGLNNESLIEVLTIHTQFMTS